MLQISVCAGLHMKLLLQRDLVQVPLEKASEYGGTTH